MKCTFGSGGKGQAWPASAGLCGRGRGNRVGRDGLCVLTSFVLSGTVLS